MVTAEDLRTYLRLPPDDSENLNGYLSAAVAKARSAGIPDFQYNALYDQFLLQFAGLLHDARSMDPNAADPAKVQMLINSFVLPLRYAEDGEPPEPEPEPDPDPDPEPEPDPDPEPDPQGTEEPAENSEEEG